MSEISRSYTITDIISMFKRRAENHGQTVLVNELADEYSETENKEVGVYIT